MYGCLPGNLQNGLFYAKYLNGIPQTFTSKQEYEAKEHFSALRKYIYEWMSRMICFYPQYSEQNI